MISNLFNDLLLIQSWFSSFTNCKRFQLWHGIRIDKLIIFQKQYFYRIRLFCLGIFPLDIDHVMP